MGMPTGSRLIQIDAKLLELIRVAVNSYALLSAEEREQINESLEQARKSNTPTDSNQYSRSV